MNVSKQRGIKATPESIWQAISTVESLPDWLAGVQSASHISGPSEGVGRRQRISRVIYQHDVEVEQEVTAWEPGRRMEVKHLRETSGGRDLQGVQDFLLTVTLSPAGQRTEVRVEYSWKARAGVTWLLSVLFGGKTMGRELSDTLKKIEVLVKPRKA